MNLIDTQLNDRQPKSKTRGLNLLLLVAYLLSHLASSNVSFIYTDIYATDKDISHYVIWGIEVFCVVIAALLCDMTRQGRVFNIIGFSLMIVVGIVTYSSNMLTGLPLAILFYLAQAFTGIALLQRLLRNTGFFGTAQQTILLSVAGIHLLTALFYQATKTLGENHENNTGTFMVSLLCLAAALVLILVDQEKEEAPQTSMREYTNEHPDFWLKFILPLALATILVQWINIQPTRVYYYAVNVSRDSHVQPMLSFINMVLAGGLLALLVMGAKIKSQWVYIGIGTGLMLGAALIAMGIGKDDEIASWQLWAMAIMTSVGSSLAFFGITFWISRHAKFPWLATLLAFHVFMENASYFITEYWSLFITENNMHFNFSNF